MRNHFGYSIEIGISQYPKFDWWYSKEHEGFQCGFAVFGLYLMIVFYWRIK